MGISISDRMSYRNHYMCSGEATSILYSATRLLRTLLVYKIIQLAKVRNRIIKPYLHVVRVFYVLTYFLGIFLGIFYWNGMTGGL